MSSDDNLFKVLICFDDKSETDRLISLLRNASYKPEAKHVDQEDVLVKLLSERPWDLLISQMDSTKLPAKKIFSNIRRQNLDIPVIMIDPQRQPANIVEGLRMGAADVVMMDEDQHMLQVVSRTLYNLDNRRKLRHWKRKYYDSEKRSERLLHTSKDGIAIVQEGTYIYVNNSFAEVLDYPNGDSMICLPMIDTISDGYQESLKPYLGLISAEDSIETREIQFSALNCTEHEVELKAVVSQIEYEGEPALEFLIPHQFTTGTATSGASLQESSAIQLNVMFDAINNAIRKAAQHLSKAVLLYIEIDKFSEVQGQLGLEKMEKLITELAHLLDNEAGTKYSLHRFHENHFILLMQNTSAEAGLRFAKSLCRTIADKAIDVDGTEQHLTLSIGASVISDAVVSVEGCIHRSIDALKAARKESPQGNIAELFENDFDGGETDLEEIAAIGREYLEKGLFQLSYQPIISLHGTPQPMFEVLLQVAPEGSPRDLPDNFISLLFNTGIAQDVDRWVILESVKILSKKLQTDPETKLFVNISSATMCDKEFIPWLKVALKASGVPTSSLVFQLREIDVARFQEQAKKTIELFNKVQSQVALSRFGLSVDPMELVNALPLDYVKFDNQLIKKTQNGDPNDEMEHLVDALKNANQTMIVPFVESAQMIPELWQSGVHYIQGHFLQPPMADLAFDFQAEN